MMITETPTTLSTGATVNTSIGQRIVWEADFRQLFVKIAVLVYCAQDATSSAEELVFSPLFFHIHARSFN